MLKQRMLVLFMILLFVVLLVACQQTPPPFECTDALGCVTINPGDPIKISVIQDLSGGASTFGNEQAQVIEFAVAEHNNQLLGHPIELITEDEQCSAEGGGNAALRVIADPQVVAVLGTTCSGAAAEAAKSISKTGLVMISGLNGSPSLTSFGGQQGDDWQAGYFRTAPNDTVRAQAAATFAFSKLGATNVTTINQGDNYSEGIVDVFAQKFTELGGQSVFDISIDPNDTDMLPFLTTITDNKSEFVFLVLNRPAADFFVQQANTIEAIKTNVTFMSSGLLSDEFIEAIGSDGIGLYFTAPAPFSGAANDKLVADYTAKYGEPPSTAFYGYAYDATNLLLTVIETVAVQDEDGTLHLGRQALRDALYATTNFEGVTGQLSCDEFGDCGGTNFNVMRLDDPTAGLQGLTSNVVYVYEQTK